MKLSRLPITGPLIRGFFWDLPTVVASFISRSASRSTCAKRKLLIVKLDEIGDFLLFMSTMLQIREIYAPQEWEITLLGNNLWRDLALASGVADHYRFLDLWHFEINPVYRAKTLSVVAAGGFDLVVQGVYSRSLYRDDCIVGVSKAPRRIGYCGDAYNSPPPLLTRGNRYYTHLIEPPMGSGWHMLQTHARLAKALGGNESALLPDLPVYAVPAGTLTPQISDSYFVVVPGARVPIRQWPPERFAGLAQFIHSRTGLHPVILGGRVDGNVALELIARAPRLPWVILSGKTSLMEALSIISSAKFYIGNDTGLTHMATMARVPTLAIVGGAYPGRDFPYPEGVAPHLTAVVNLPPCKSCGWRCGSKIGDLAKCIHDISLERVLASIEWF